MFFETGSFEMSASQHSLEINQCWNMDSLIPDYIIRMTIMKKKPSYIISSLCLFLVLINIEMLNRDDFDFFYLIICSRGPGSETITVDNITGQRDNIEFLEASETEFEKFGVYEATTNFNDEGPVIAVPSGTNPLKGLYSWLKKDTVDIGEGYPDFNYGPAYLSACLRAFLPGEIVEDGNPWTSVNGWRKLEIELPSKGQFELLMEATGETAEQLGQWDCAVLKEAAKRYREGTLPEREFPGC